MLIPPSKPAKSCPLVVSVSISPPTATRPAAQGGPPEVSTTQPMLPEDPVLPEMVLKKNPDCANWPEPVPWPQIRHCDTQRSLLGHRVRFPRKKKFARLRKRMQTCKKLRSNRRE